MVHRRQLIGCLTGMSVLAAPLAAEDYGTMGPTWEIAEPSLLDVIQARMGQMEASGELAALQQEMQDRTRAYVARPRPVTGLLPATQERQFEVDLSITLTRDLADHEGRVFARAGTVINPLDYSMFNKRIVFIDGDESEQVEFAISEGNELDTLIVLTNGAPLDLMREYGRRFYFDQDAVMTDRFRITRLPSEVWRDGRVMMVREVPVALAGEGDTQ